MEKKELFKCSNCGMLTEGGDGNPPTRCCKCENTKFFRVGK